MPRLRTVSVLLLVIAMAIATVPPAAASRSAGPGRGRRPNIVFVMADDMRPDEMETVASLRPDGGFAWVRSHGVRTGMWLNDNLCCPSRTTILTGQTAFHHGVLSNDRFPALDRHSLPVWLREAGYCTGFVGRYLNKFNQRRPRPPGWRYWEPLVGSFEVETGYAVLRRDGRIRQPGHVHHRRARADGARAGARLRGPDDEPRSSRCGRSHRTSAPTRRPATQTSRCPGRPRIRASTRPTSPTSRHGCRTSTARTKARPYYANQFAQRVRTLLSVDDALERVDR